MNYHQRPDPRTAERPSVQPPSTVGTYPYSIDSQIAARLHWFKIGVDQTVRRILRKHGAVK